MPANFSCERSSSVMTWRPRSSCTSASDLRSVVHFVTASAGSANDPASRPSTSSRASLALRIAVP